MNDPIKNICDSINTGPDFSNIIGNCEKSVAGKRWRRLYLRPWGLFFSLSGTGWIELNNQRFPVPSHTLLVYKPNYPFVFHTETDWTYIWFHYQVREHMVGNLVFDEVLPGLGSITCENEVEAKTISDTLLEAVNLEKVRTPGNEELAMLLIETVLQRMVNTQKRNASRHTEIAERAAKLLTRDKCGSVPEIAAALGISEPLLYMIFRQEMGCSPRQYREVFLLRKAWNLLLVSDFSISEIAELIGMCDRYYFSARFKKNFGISPGAVRRHGG